MGFANCLSIDEIWALLPNGFAGFGYGAINVSGLAKKKISGTRRSGGGAVGGA